MDKEEIFNTIADLLVDRFEIKKEDVTMNLNFKKDLDADSIDFVEFVLELEDAFGNEIPDEDAEKLQTVAEAVDYISANQKA